jgi:hypothetical protein
VHKTKGQGIVAVGEGPATDNEDESKLSGPTLGLPPDSPPPINAPAISPDFPHLDLRRGDSEVSVDSLPGGDEQQKASDAASASSASASSTANASSTNASSSGSGSRAKSHIPSAHLFMASTKFLSGLDPEQFRELYDRVEWVVLKSGDVLFQEGATPDDGLYIVVDGKLGVYKQIGDTSVHLSDFRPVSSCFALFSRPDQIT